VAERAPEKDKPPVAEKAPEKDKPPVAEKAPEKPRPAPLKDPLPTIELILVDQNRRMAVIGGAVVSVGDAVGPRIVAQIEPDFVVLREPSGALVRVSIRGK